MPHEILNVSVLNGSDSSHSPLLDTLAAYPQIRIQAEARVPEDLLKQNGKREPDLIIVDLDHQHKLPNWLGDLNQHLSHAMVMVCSYNCERDFLIQVIQLGAREFLPLPLVPADFEAALARVAAKRRRLSCGGSPGQMVVVTGLKGGAGVTSTAVNLAVSLAEKHPDRVALVDLGRPYPDVAKYLDQAKQTGLADLAGHLDKLDAEFVTKLFKPHEARLAILHGIDDPSDWQYLDPQAMNRFWVIVRSLFDWIVVDLGHWPDELYLKTLQEADKVLFLVDVLIPNLKNTKNLFEMLQQAGISSEKLKLVVNRYSKGNGNGLALDNLKSSYPDQVFSILPSDFPSLSQAINHGVPLVQVAPRSKLCRQLQNLGKELVELCTPGPEVKAGSRPLARRRFLLF